MAGWTPLICPDGGLTVITGHSRLLCAVLCGKRGKAGIGKADRIMNTGTVVYKKGVMCLLLSGTAAVPVRSGGGFPFSVQSGRRGGFSARTACPARAFSRARPRSTWQRYQGNNGKLAVHGDCRYQLCGRRGYFLCGQSVRRGRSAGHGRAVHGKDIKAITESWLFTVTAVISCAAGGDIFYADSLSGAGVQPGTAAQYMAKISRQ